MPITEIWTYEGALTHTYFATDKYGMAQLEFRSVRERQKFIDSIYPPPEVHEGRPDPYAMMEKGTKKKEKKKDKVHEEVLEPLDSDDDDVVAVETADTFDKVEPIGEEQYEDNSP